MANSLLVIAVLVVWGGIAIVATRNSSRLGFFASGAAVTAWATWWTSNDRGMALQYFGAPVFWDLVFMIAGICMALTRRHQMWLKNPQTMKLVTERPGYPTGNSRKTSHSYATPGWCRF